MKGLELEGLRRGVLVNPDYQPTFDELSEDFADEHVPLLDQRSVQLRGLTEDQRHWREYGYVIKRNFVPHPLIDEFLRLRTNLGLGHGSFPEPIAYAQHEVVTDICCSRELHHLLVDLLGEEMGIHFNLTDFKSTERGWHQDDYFNPPEVHGRYCAIWMAMGDIHPDAGPFEFVPASHKWPCMRREKVRALIKPEANSNEKMEWPIFAEYFVNKAIDQKIKDTGATVERFLARKGDILIWHGKLVHRGSIPNNPDLIRPALISHYSNIRSRRDFSNDISRHKGGGYYWNWGRTLTRQHSMPAITAPYFSSRRLAGAIKRRALSLVK